MNVNSEKGTGLLYGTLSDARTRLHGDSRKNIARPLDHLQVHFDHLQVQKNRGRAAPPIGAYSWPSRVIILMEFLSIIHNCR